MLTDCNESKGKPQENTPWKHCHMLSLEIPSSPPQTLSYVVPGNSEVTPPNTVMCCPWEFRGHTPMETRSCFVSLKYDILTFALAFGKARINHLHFIARKVKEGPPTISKQNFSINIFPHSYQFNNKLAQF